MAKNINVIPTIDMVVAGGRSEEMIDPDLYDVKFEKLDEIDGGGWLVSYPDLPGCHAIGKTKSDAFKSGTEAITIWIRANKERGLEIPAPRSASNPSGNIRIRVPRLLHKHLKIFALHEKQSLNSYVAMVLLEELDLAEGMKFGGHERPEKPIDCFIEETTYSSGISDWTYDDHDQYVGQWNQRFSSELHHRLRFRAQEQDVSVNTLIITLLALGVGRRIGLLQEAA